MSANFASEGDQASLQGRLDFDSVPAIWPRLREWVSASPRGKLSLAAVESSNSAALALLLEAQELAAGKGGSLQLQDLPDELLALAELSNLSLNTHA